MGIKWSKLMYMNTQSDMGTQSEKGRREREAHRERGAQKKYLSELYLNEKTDNRQEMRNKKS